MVAFLAIAIFGSINFPKETIIITAIVLAGCMLDIFLSFLHRKLISKLARTVNQS